eukprot:TRINITY_DN6134_c0_g1_i1.p1 TRINITY_DN6134_c0_g1~~TRINITY_DN6134_c0_g1_i1.p1  ORF type:complete len:192 (-),score=47.83 TRINITY_DN6134_c0_g1_i1:3-578(-)
MFIESFGKPADAEELYVRLLKKDPSDVLSMKRRVALRKAQNDVPGAVKLLVEFLNDFMGDSDAWQELADLYLLINMPKQALFCLEEVMLSSPQNYLLHSQYAEILYTLGGTENLVVARKYFASSYELNPSSNNLRALFGICSCAQALLATKAPKVRDDTIAILDYARAQLKSYYAGKPDERYVVAMLDAIQ